MRLTRYELEAELARLKAEVATVKAERDEALAKAAKWIDRFDSLKDDAAYKCRKCQGDGVIRRPGTQEYDDCSACGGRGY